MAPSNLQPPPQVAAEKRGRLPKKESKNNYSSYNSSKYYRTSLSRVVMERERRKILGDSIVALKELLPVRRRSTTSQMDKCTVLKEGRKHILDLKEELQALAKKKEELTAMSAIVVSQQYVNGSESVMVEEAMSAVTSSKKDDMMECRNRGSMFHDVVYNAPNVFVTLRIPEGRGVRLSRVFGAIEKANVDISNAMASWRDNDRSFCIMVHGKIGGKGASSIQALKQDLCRVSSKP